MQHRAEGVGWHPDSGKKNAGTRHHHRFPEESAEFRPDWHEGQAAQAYFSIKVVAASGVATPESGSFLSALKIRGTAVRMEHLSSNWSLP